MKLRYVQSAECGTRSAEWGPRAFSRRCCALTSGPTAPCNGRLKQADGRRSQDWVSQTCRIWFPIVQRCAFAQSGQCDVFGIGRSRVSSTYLTALDSFGHRENVNHLSTASRDCADMCGYVRLIWKNQSGCTKAPISPISQFRILPWWAVCPNCGDVWALQG